MKSDDASEFYFRARAFHKAAKTALATLESNSTRQDWDIEPVVLLYRQAIELHLKDIVLGPGNNYLGSKRDLAWAHGTHSLRRLQKMARVVLRAAEWDQDERDAAESGLAGVAAVVEWFAEPGESGDSFSFGQFLQITRRMDDATAFLDETSDSLAAMWDTRDEGGVNGNSGLTIQ